MRNERPDARWRRLIELLAPFHEQAQFTARRLGRFRGDGDDLFQEAVLRAHAKLPSLRDEGRFRSWFYAVLLSVHRSRSRRGFWLRLVPLEDAMRAGRDFAGEDGRERDEQRRQAERASRALATLPAVQREAVVLHDLDGFTMEEIADMQKVTVSAVKSRVARGRERLRRYYRRRMPQAGHASSKTVAPRGPWVRAESEGGSS